LEVAVPPGRRAEVEIIRPVRSPSTCSPRCPRALAPRNSLDPFEGARSGSTSLAAALLLDVIPADDAAITADPSVRPRAWDPGWIPISPKGTGEYLMLDLNPGTPSCRGQVITYNPRSHRRAVVAPDFGAWLNQRAHDFESGVWRAGDDGTLERA
jgi:cell wall assembly regulator SMI1